MTCFAELYDEIVWNDEDIPSDVYDIPFLSQATINVSFAFAGMSRY